MYVCIFSAQAPHLNPVSKDVSWVVCGTPDDCLLEQCSKIIRYSVC